MEGDVAVERFPQFIRPPIQILRLWYLTSVRPAGLQRVIQGHIPEASQIPAIVASDLVEITR